ncbi:hypothetical protein [Embleya sp. NPDC005575]|uniref:hypothetical protein n=1 Tax=Embleya sp. NPDC005575 TaxID=3156892 RepID=UPI0033A21ED7
MEFVVLPVRDDRLRPIAQDRYLVAEHLLREPRGRALVRDVPAARVRRGAAAPARAWPAHRRLMVVQVPICIFESSGVTGAPAGIPA